MTARDALRELKSCGTAQNRKIYRRHGVGEKQFGVSYADLKRLAKRIRTDHELAERLWESGNHDARVLATFVADPERMTRRQLDAWARELDCYPVADAFAGLAARSPHRAAKMERWTRSKGEWTGRAGWAVLGRIAMDEKEERPDRYFEEYVRIIEEEIHTRKNHVRDAMNTALIAIGIRNARLEKKALAAAKRIGKVEVDHGETGCKTPDAAAYIRRTLERKRKKVRGLGGR